MTTVQGGGSGRGSESTPRAVLLIDDHPLFRAGMAVTLRRCQLPVQVHEAATVAAALACIATTPRLDLIVYDWHLPQLGGMAGLHKVGQCAPGVPVLVVSADDEEAIAIAVHAAGAGFLSKTEDAHEIRRVLDRLLALPPASPSANRAAQGSAGTAQLTQRQHQVLSGLARGLSNKRIAGQLGISDKTVNAHVTDVLRALGANNRIEAVLAAARLGLVELPHGGAPAR